ncbi:MAG: FecR domain-containing protein [Proteobacteria bacterium]|nr:FecR domain-containing protein [Pseudomonadota bacterium]
MFERPVNATDLKAAEWVVRLEDRERALSAREQGEFFAWLMQSADHVKAFLGVADLSHVLDAFDRERRLDVEKLFLTGRSAAVPLRPNLAFLAGNRANQLAARPRRWVMPLALSVVLLCCAFFGWHSWSASKVYRTATGEQRTIRLTDGTVVTMNTHSRIAVRFSEQNRQVDLLEGEALFAVAHESSRPFVVQTRHARIRAVGTQFNVYDHSGETTVAVIEGAVQVVPAENPSVVGMVQAGEQARVDQSRDLRRETQDVRNAVAWRERRLVFENASLGEVMAEFNRYNAILLRADESLAAGKHLTGVFSADQPQSLLHYLEQDPGISIERVGDEVRIHLK